MSSYDSITHGILREILAEIKAMRKECAEGRAAYKSPLINALGNFVPVGTTYGPLNKEYT